MKRLAFLLSVLILLLFSRANIFSEEALKDAFLADLGISNNDMEEFLQVFNVKNEKLMKNLQENLMQQVQEKIMKESQAGKQIDQIEIMAFGAGETMIPVADLYQAEFENFFSVEQSEKFLLRNFQLYRGYMDDLRATNDIQTIVNANDTCSSALNFMTPDSLELTSSQKTEIQKIMKETAGKAVAYRLNATMTLRKENPKKAEKLNEISQKIFTVQSEEERRELEKQLMVLNNEIFRDLAPAMKKNILDGNKKFMSILTDAQKAKIEKIMEDVPDYLWAIFPQNQDKNRPWKPGIHSWTPGQGVPQDTGKANSETRLSPPSGGKKFPSGTQD